MRKKSGFGIRARWGQRCAKEKRVWQLGIKRQELAINRQPSVKKTKPDAEN